MISLSLKERKLLIYLIVINMISILINIGAQVGPAPDCYQYTDDPCTTTCIGCTYTRATNTKPSMSKLFFPYNPQNCTFRLLPKHLLPQEVAMFLLLRVKGLLF